MYSSGRLVRVVCLMFCALLHLELLAQQNQSGWTIKTDDIVEAYAGPTLSNGCIGVVPNRELFLTKEVVLGGVYDLKKGAETRGLLSALNPMNLRFAVDGEMLELSNVNTWEQELDMKQAKLVSRFNYSNKVEVEYDIVAPRNLPYVSIMNVRVKALSDCTLDIRSMVRWSESSWRSPAQSSRILIDGETHIPLHQCKATSVYGKTETYTTSSFIFPKGNECGLTSKDYPYHPNLYGFMRMMKRGESFSFSLVSSYCTNQHFIDPKSESERFVIFAMLNGTKRVIAQHCMAWRKLWKNDIVIQGNIQDQLDVRLALYHLYSFVRKGSGWSIPPMGLSSSEGYAGHFFWDAEMWMYPVLLVMNPELAKSMIDFRLDTVEAAEKRASNYGYDGVMYPWETDDSGEEMTPTWALTGTFEHHITGDVGWAIWSYYCVAQDKEWLRDRGYPVLKKIADFWASRVHENKDKSYSILNVVGADEYAPNVDDNAFTNGIAKYVLVAATRAAQTLGLPADPHWMYIAEHLRFNYFDDGVMKEHRDYSGEIIKQADVNLLTFPLHIVDEKQSILANVNYYEPKVAKEGPAMTRAIYSIIYSRLGNVKEAYRLFKDSYIYNRNAPYGVLSETRDRNNPYFVTAAGGLLQSVLFGFCGLEITESGVKPISAPLIPKEWRGLEVKY
ncbi:hypothetical protein OAT16_03475 [Prolixibacteraceae bacterium]|nr:hypothetical protein [Prolixibacteraceae bacterium]